MKHVVRRLYSHFWSAAPFLIIGGLLAAALFIKPKAVGKTIEPPPIDRRDRFYGIAVPDPNVIWAAGNGGKVIRSEDGGKSWNVQETPVTFHLQDIAAWDVRKAVAVGNQGVIIVTGNGGKTWKEVQAPKSEVANKLVRVKTLPDGSAWAVGEMGAILSSKDYGATWTRRSKEEDVGWNGIAFADAKNGWIVGEFGRMLRTADGGNTWRPVKGPVGSSLMSVAFRDAANGAACGFEGLVLVTADGGRSWKAANRATKTHLLDVAWDGGAWVAVGSKGTIVKSDAAGREWTARRLSDQDLAWHTKIVAGAKGGVIYVSGATTGVLEGGKWNVYRSKVGG